MGECSTYGPWTAGRSSILISRPNSGRQIVLRRRSRSARARSCLSSTGPQRACFVIGSTSDIFPLQDFPRGIEVTPMPLLLTEADVKAILTMPLAMELVEESFRRLADGTAVSHPRQRLRLAEKGLMHYMAASDSAGGYLGLKIYTVSPSGARFLVPLFSGHSGELSGADRGELSGADADGRGERRGYARVGAGGCARGGHDRNGLAGADAARGGGAGAKARACARVRARRRAAGDICQGHDRANWRARDAGGVCRGSGAGRRHRDHVDDVNDSGGRRAMARARACTSMRPA